LERNKHTPIFITGATGFLGSYLLRYLVHYGYQHIRAVRRAKSDLSLVADIVDQVEWVEGDVLNPVFLEESMSGMRQVYHCAAVISFDPRDRQKMMTINVEGTANVVNTALHLGIEKLVHVSSIAALGRTKQQTEISEKADWVRSKYNSNYAISKYLSEQEVWRGMAEGLNVAIVNPSIILGSGRWDEGPLKLFQLAWKNFPFYTQSHTGFVDVRDVARFMVKLMESNISAQRYILSAEDLSFQKILHTMAEQLGAKPPYIAVTPLIQQFIWRWEWLRTRLFGGSPLITRETAANAGRSYRYINEKSKAAFDFEYVPILQTIAEAGKQFKEATQNDFEAKVLPLI
jgi:nucleoside-diphosphate-sugar epimerase